MAEAAKRTPADYLSALRRELKAVQTRAGDDAKRIAAEVAAEIRRVEEQLAAAAPAGPAAPAQPKA